MALHSVERGLVDVVRDPAASPAVGPRGSIWCAAQALDARALAWQRLHPEAGWRYDALGMRLEREMAVHSRFALTATYVAATSRRANVALEQPASGVEPSETALEAFEAAAVALAATGIQAWVGVRSRRPAGSFIEQTLTMQRLAARVGASAALDPHAGRSAGGWLATAIAHTPPNLSLAVAEDPDADRVLGAEARIASSEAWIARGVEELRAVRGRRMDLGAPSMSARPGSRRGCDPGGCAPRTNRGRGSRLGSTLVRSCPTRRHLSDSVSRARPMVRRYARDAAC